MGATASSRSSSRRSASGKTTDIYKSAFGLLPELTEVLGDAEAAKRMLKGSLA